MTEQEAYNKGYKQGYADRIEMEKALRVEDCIHEDYPYPKCSYCTRPNNCIQRQKARDKIL